ncbi:MAG TPA: transposase, partial [Fimbriimonas sp.]
TSTSKRVKGEFPRCEAFAWQAGYGAFSVGPSEADRLIAYIRSQEEHHRKATFQDELRGLLQEAGLEFDERYLWD